MLNIGHKDGQKPIGADISFNYPPSSDLTLTNKLGFFVG